MYDRLNTTYSRCTPRDSSYAAQADQSKVAAKVRNDLLAPRLIPWDRELFAPASNAQDGRAALEADSANTWHNYTGLPCSICPCDSITHAPTPALKIGPEHRGNPENKIH